MDVTTTGNMMMRHELLLLRHAKSSWDSAARADFDRPLAPRGIRNATRLGAYTADQDYRPDLTLCSAAQRARETAQLVLSQNPGAQLEIRESLYHAGLATLVNSVREQPDDLARLMIVGHNPGMDQLLVYLCENEISLTGSGKLMTTATLARIECKCAWAQLAPEHCNLIALLRPGDLPRQ